MNIPPELHKSPTDTLASESPEVKRVLATFERALHTADFQNGFYLVDGREVILLADEIYRLRKIVESQSNPPAGRLVMCGQCGQIRGYIEGPVYPREEEEKR